MNLKLLRNLIRKSQFHFPKLIGRSLQTTPYGKGYLDSGKGVETCLDVRTRREPSTVYSECVTAL